MSKFIGANGKFPAPFLGPKIAHFDFSIRMIVSIAMSASVTREMCILLIYMIRRLVISISFSHPLFCFRFLYMTECVFDHKFSIST